MHRIFQVLAVVLVGVAAFSLYRGDTDTAFETGVLAACSFFLSYRFQIKDRIAERETLEYDDEYENEYEDEPEELTGSTERPANEAAPIPENQTRQ
jgi:hypothetical protein